jgi:hypothetical protein
MADNTNLYSVDQDYNAAITATPFAATSGRVGQAPATSQGGRVAVGLTPSNLFSPFYLDAGGNVRVALGNPAGSSAMVATASTPPAPASQYGTLCMARVDLPTSQYYPHTLDGTLALNAHLKSKQTFHAVSVGVATVTSGTKSMISLLNGSTAMIVRVQEIWCYTPPTSSTSGSLLGLGGTTTTYTPMIFELRRMTAQTTTGATAITPTLADSQDTLTSGIVVYSAATITAQATAPYYRFDANYNGGGSWYRRGDPNEKTLVLRPGEGMTVNSLYTGTSVSFDMSIVFTQCAA